MPPQGGAQSQPVRGMPPGIVNPGGEGMGIRNRGVARPQQRTSGGSGSPMSSVQQNGLENTSAQNTSNAIQRANRPRGA